MILSIQQRNVLRGMAGAVLVTSAALALGYVWRIAAAPTALLGTALLAPALCLLASIARLASHRFREPADLDGSALTTGTPTARLHQAIVQNTLEQTVLAAVAYSSAVLVMPAERLGVVPAAASCFIVGRVAFALGYRYGAIGRAFGFALTFYPTVALLGLSIAAVLA